MNFYDVLLARYLKESGVEPPSGTLYVYQNGEYDVAQYEKVNVNLSCYSMEEIATMTISGAIGSDEQIKIAEYAFYHYKEITRAVFFYCQGVGSYAFSGCTSLTDVEMGGMSGTIGVQAFNGCTSLQNANVRGCTEIWANAFKSCRQLETVYLAGITNMYDSSFGGCTSLANMYIENISAVPTILSSTFSGVPDTMTVHVPSDLYDAFVADPLWGRFNIVTN